MPEKKVKPAAKKVTAVKVSSKAAGKPKTTKATLTTAAKKTPVKKTPVAGPPKPRATTAKKTVIPAVKKAVAASRTAVAEKSPETKPKHVTPGKAAKLTPEERYRMVETTAYFIAERHGFQGRSDEHWAAAELEVAARLGQ